MLTPRSFALVRIGAGPGCEACASMGAPAHRDARVIVIHTSKSIGTETLFYDPAGGILQRRRAGSLPEARADAAKCFPADTLIWADIPSETMDDFAFAMRAGHAPRVEPDAAHAPPPAHVEHTHSDVPGSAPVLPEVGALGAVDAVDGAGGVGAVGVLHEIVYVSRRLGSLSSEQVVDDIVLPASRVNRELDITGCLWFDRERFLQILEGPRESVEIVYASICRDKRHSDVRLLAAGPLAERSFQRWGMRLVSGAGDESIDDLIRTHERRTAPQDASRAAAPRAKGTVPGRAMSESGSGGGTMLVRIRGWMRRLSEAQASEPD